MKRKHTPGPWRIGDAQNTVFGPPNGNPSPQTIAHLGVIDHEANGRLIAAAPELLEACKLAYESLRTKLGNVKKDFSAHVAFAALGSAIHKAEGKQ